VIEEFSFGSISIAIILFSELFGLQSNPHNSSGNPGNPPKTTKY